MSQNQANLHVAGHVNILGSQVSMDDVTAV